MHLKKKKSNKVDANPGTSRKRNYIIEGDSIIKDIDGVNASKNQTFKVTCHQDATIFFK